MLPFKILMLTYLMETLCLFLRVSLPKSKDVHIEKSFIHVQMYKAVFMYIFICVYIFTYIKYLNKNGQYSIIIAKNWKQPECPSPIK